MSGLFETYARDSKLENEGAPYVRAIHEGRPEDEREETYFLARLDETANKAYGAAMRAFRRKYATQLSTDTLPQDVNFEENLRIFVDTILKGWKNVIVDAPIPGKQGKLPYTRENALWLMKTLRDLYRELRFAAVEGKLFQDERFLGEAVRSPDTSNGSSNTVSEA